MLPGTSVSPTSKTAQTPFTTSSLTFTADATHLAGEAAPLRWQGNSAAENAQQLKKIQTHFLYTDNGGLAHSEMKRIHFHSTSKPRNSWANR